MRTAALLAALALLALFAATFGGDFIARAQAQDGVMNAPTLTSDEPGTLVVSWELPSPEPSDYRIDWAKSGEDYTSWKVDEGHAYPAGTETTVTIEGLEAGAEYKVRMRARYNQGDHADDPWSGPWTADTTVLVAAKQSGQDRGGRGANDPPPPDGEMTAPVLASDTPGTIVVTWEIPSPEPDDYRIDYAKSGEDYTSAEVEDGHVYPAGTETTATLTGLDAGAEYKVRMQARYAGDNPSNGPWTGDALVTVAEGEPLPPPVIVDVIEPEDLVTAQQSEVGTLYSNLRQPAAHLQVGIGHLTAISHDTAAAIPFTTGANPAGYTLEGATVDIAEVVAPSGGTFEGTLKASIHGDSSGTPGTEVHALGETSSPMAGQTSFDTATAFTLKPGTTYWLVLELDEQTNFSQVQLATVSGGGADPGGEPGWSSNTFFSRETATTPWIESLLTEERIKFALLGAALSNLLLTNTDLAAGSGTTYRMGGSEDFRTAVRFTTGPRTSLVNEVVVDVSSVAADSVPTLQIFSSTEMPDSEPPTAAPNAALHTFESPATFETGLQSFTAPSPGFTLAPNTSYWIVASGSGDYWHINRTGRQVASHAGQDSESGWSFHGRAGSSSTTPWSSIDVDVDDRYSLARMQIKGFLPPPMLVSATVNHAGDQLELIFDQAFVTAPAFPLTSTSRV